AASDVYKRQDLWRDSRQTPLISSLIPQSRRECGYLQG
ncbi:hypothetical protein N2L03_22435, partial [Escherichia coli]